VRSAIRVDNAENVEMLEPETPLSTALIRSNTAVRYRGSPIRITGDSDLPGNNVCSVQKFGMPKDLAEILMSQSRVIFCYLP